MPCIEGEASLRVTYDKKGGAGYMKKADKKKWSTKKNWAVTAIAMALLALLIVPVFGWMYMERSMETMTKINIPYALKLGAGNTRPIQELELSNIDVSGEQKYKDIVFCVYSSQENREYDLQLAHTSNIGFTYNIYHASRDENGSVNYLKENYSQGADLKGSYLNKQDGSKYATDRFHETTYDSYNSVQISAEPLYWKTTEKQTLNKTTSAITTIDEDTYYVDYYILRISWDDTVQNNKETDMIYIMAK